MSRINIFNSFLWIFNPVSKTTFDNSFSVICMFLFIVLCDLYVRLQGARKSKIFSKSDMLIELYKYAVLNFTEDKILAP